MTDKTHGLYILNAGLAASGAPASGFIRTRWRNAPREPNLNARKVYEMTSPSSRTAYAVSKTATQLVVVAPYNPAFITAAKSDLGAKWNSSAWTFDLRDEAEAMELVRKFYGWNPGMALVSVRVLFDEEKRASQGPFVLLGRVLASATGRDSGAKLGDGVRLRAGGVSSGGSMKNWLTRIDEGTELVVHDVPEGMARNYVEGILHREGVRVELLHAAPPVDTTALIVERGHLMTRISEIDKL